MKRFTYSFVVAAFLQVAWNASVIAHEFETGHIERSIDVVVRDQKCEVTYAIGLSDTTIVDWLVKDELIDAGEETDFRKRIVQFEKEEAGKAKEGKQKSTKSMAAEKKIHVQRSSPNETQPETKLEARKNTVSKEAPQPLEFQSELLALLREKLSGPICENLELKCDGKLLNKAEIVVANSPRHHVSMEIVFSVELPDAEKIKLSIVDRNFLDAVNSLKSDKSDDLGKTAVEKTEQDASGQEFRYLGNIRLACRVKGNAVQLNSNVAPILARAKLTDVGPLNLEQRIEAATIRTMIAVSRRGKR